MENDRVLNRRTLLQSAGAAAVTTLAASRAQIHAADAKGGAAELSRSHIKQSVCRWCYGRIPLEKLATEAKKMGFVSVELLLPADYLKIKPLGLTCAMLSCATPRGKAFIPDGLNRKENHDWLEKALRANIDFAAAEGLPNVICMAGNRRGMPDDEGMANCVIGLKRLVGYAEQKKITLCMEGLNSKVNHKDYMYDHTNWGVELAKKVGSPRFKLLYDIYHMQIMEGDVIRTIQDNHEYIAHYHTGGVPGRHEIDETQELHYPAIVKAILKTGYTGFLGQEYIPAQGHDALASLKQGFGICNV